MKKLASLSILLIASAMYASDQRAADIERLQTSGVVLTQIMSAPDRGIPDAIMDGAKCIAVIPSMLKASFIFGANYGKGVATCRTKDGWSAPAFFKLTGGSFGFQAGGQASDLVLIVRTDDGMQHLLQSKFKLGADASAAAGPVGRDAQAMTDLTLRAQVLTYSRSRGLFLGVSLSGGVIKQDQDDTTAFYGKDWTFYSLLNGEVAPPKEAEILINTVEKYAPTPRPKATPTSASATTPAAAPVVAEAAQPAMTPTASSTPETNAMPAPAAATTETAPAATPATTAAPAAAPTAPVNSSAAPTASPASTAATAPMTAPPASSTPAPAQTPAASAPAAGTPGGR